MGNKAVFVDRDGTINVDGPYLSDPDKFIMYPGVGKGIKELNDKGYKIIVITNQSGIARGYFTEKDLADIHERMKQEFRQFNVELDGIYYCPHHPEDNCNCRKPKTGLFDKAIKDQDIDVTKSFMVGDKNIDIVAGSKMGLRTILLIGLDMKEELLSDIHQCNCTPDYLADDFMDAVDWIVRKNESNLYI